MVASLYTRSNANLQIIHARCSLQHDVRSSRLRHLVSVWPEHPGTSSIPMLRLNYVVRGSQ